jgi:nicotinamide-nucleotide adenylyltransferase
MKEYNSIIIGIGSSQYSNTLENPFSYSERKEMITRVLTAASISSFQIEPIPDIHDPPNWVDHVTKHISDFNMVYTNNPFTNDLFKQKGFIVKQTSIHKRESLSGNHIRKCIIQGKPLKDLVPREVVEYLIEIDGIQRLQKLASQH